MESKVKAKRGIPHTQGLKKKKKIVAIDKDFQQPAALCLYSGFGAIKKAVNKRD